MADFFERAEPIFDLYAQGKYADALRPADQLAQEFPDQYRHTSYWRMCLLALLGQKKESLQAMEDAISQGVWWAEGRWRKEPDLKSLQGDAQFEHLVAVCMERYQFAKLNTKPELMILEPNTINEAHFPLLMILHGRDGSAEREKHQWQMARDLGWLTAFAQSSQISSLDSYIWDDIQLAQQELRQHLKYLQGKYALDARRIILAGFSQGSWIAILTALKGDIPCTAFIAVAPGRIVNDYDLPALAKSAKERRVRGVIVAGGKDPHFETMVQIGETISNHGVPLYYAYPADFKQLLEKSLQTR